MFLEDHPWPEANDRLMELLDGSRRRCLGLPLGLPYTKTTIQSAFRERFHSLRAIEYRVVRQALTIEHVSVYQ